MGCVVNLIPIKQVREGDRCHFTRSELRGAAEFAANHSDRLRMLMREYDESNFQPEPAPRP